MGLMFGSTQALLKYDVEADQPWRDPKTGYCERVKPDEAGELVYLLDPENIKDRFQGYFGNEQATSSKILRNVFHRCYRWCIACAPHHARKRV